MNATDIKLGPVRLAPGYTRWNARTYLFAAFITIGMLAFVSFIQPYLLNANLKVPQDEQGRVLGLLGFSNEIVSLLLVAPFGALSDKIGRRPVYAIGFLWLAAGFFLYPLARTFPQLLACALFFSVGVAAVGCMLATVLADIPKEESRGLFVGITGFCQGLGATLAVLVLGKVPQRLAADGMDAVTAGQITLSFAAGLCLITAIVCWLGLRRGTPSQIGEREPLRALLRTGIDAARANPRIWFAYMLQFVSFADRIVIGTFFSARLQQTAIANGQSVAEAVSAATKPYVIANSAGLLFAIFFGLALDKMNRITAGVVAMSIAGVGYIAGGFVGDPTSEWITLVAILLGMGQICAIIASQTVLGQEAPQDVRGAVFGLAGIFASCGILFTTAVGGWLYDVVSKGMPFFLIGTVNVCIMLFGLYLLLSRPKTA
ncbi:MAG: MFS transporter [Gammaproteobacteria bacterium]|nr:MFS transporter [Gammaproteobacteria bacterium]